MAHNPQIPETGELTDFETKIALSSPPPRPDFQNELAGQLRQAFQQQQLSPAAPLRRHRKFSIRTVAIFAAVLLLGVGVVIAVNTVLQQFGQFDRGFEAIYNQGLGHEIGISQTIDGFTIRLEWAYADGNRLIIAYSIQGHPGTQYTNLTNDLYQLNWRDTGADIPLYQSVNVLIDHNGDPVGVQQINSTIPTADRSMSISTFDLSALDLSGIDSLDLHLELDAYGVTVQQRTLMPIEDFDAMKQGPQGHFNFDFSVPLVDDQRVLNTPQTATDQGITLSLERVRISPSQTRVLICFAPPDPARKWTAIPHLTTINGDVAGGGGVEPYMDGNRACNDYTYFAGMYDYTGEWQLEVTELIGFGGGGGDDQQRIAGSWHFTFVVPK